MEETERRDTTQDPQHTQDIQSRGGATPEGGAGGGRPRRRRRRSRRKRGRGEAQGEVLVSARPGEGNAEGPPAIREIPVHREVPVQREPREQREPHGQREPRGHGDRHAPREQRHRERHGEERRPRPGGLVLDPEMPAPAREPEIPLDRLDRDAVRVIARLRSVGHKAYFVGGCVRDLLLGHAPKDFDLATDAHPGEVRSIFRNCRLIGRRFRLAHVFFRDGKIIEVATFRQNPVDVGDDVP
jgi:hypothetical protein